MTETRVWVLAALTALPLAAATSSALGRAHSPRLGITVSGAVVRSLELCGHARSVAVAPAAGALTALVSERGVRLRGARGRASFAVARCQAGRWLPTLTERTSAPRRGGWRAPLYRIAPGDYRLTASLRGGAQRRPLTRTAYLRVPQSRAQEPPLGTPPSGSGAGAAPIDVPISFTVRNENHSALSCSSDGATYRISAHLVEPGGGVSASGVPAAVTLYLHEFSWSQAFWRFPVAGYDYAAAQAGAGHASVVLDRLGYGDSPHPPGTQTCLGAQADMAHQIVGQLRKGSYPTPGAPSRAFARVAIAGHSVGGAIAELEAYSFKDVDALVLFAWANQGFTAHATADGTQQGASCAMGGAPGGPPGYAYYNPSSDDFRSLSFNDTDPAVLDAAVKLRQRDPCGDVNSLVPAIASSGVHAGEVAVPVLLVCGLADAVYQQPSSCQQQGQEYSASPDETTTFIAQAGHALTLERSAPGTRGQVAAWLTRHGF